MGYLKSVGTAAVYIPLFLAVITFLPGLPPDVPFSEYSITPSTKLSGKLATNDRLNGAELLHVGKIKGPESFDSYNGELYTGVHGGYVIKITEEGIKPFVKFGKQCDGIWQEEKCGRPLGLKFDKKGNLYVADAYYGIFEVKQNGNYKQIIDISKPIAGKVPRIPNSLDIAENGDIFWTDSSTDFVLHEGIFSLLANPSGRLLRYNAATKTTDVLLDNLAFANGVKLSADESYVIVLETITSRIVKYNLKGAKAGQKEIFSEGLPGFPDNVHSDNHGGFLVSLIHYIDEEQPSLPHVLTPHPNIRKMLTRLLMLVETPFKLFQEIYPNFYTEKLIKMITTFESSRFLSPGIVVILQFDATGKILDAAYAKNEKIDGISSAFIHKDYLWLGSPFNEFIARVPLKQAFPQLAQAEKLIQKSTVRETKEHVKAQSRTVESQTVKPTTTAIPISTTAKPITTTANSKETSAKVTQKTSTTQKKATTSIPSTTAQPSTVPKTTTASKTTAASKSTTDSKATTTSKPITATTKSPKSSAETIPKSASKDIKKKNIEPVVTQKKPSVDSAKESSKMEEKVSATASNVKLENAKKTNSKPETNKAKVQNAQSNIPKPV